MTVDDRRSMIIDAVIPLLIEHGRGVTTRQIAEGAGIAEGTIFRAFGDKESLVQAAIEKHLDSAALRHDLLAIDRSLPLDLKVYRIIELMQARFSHIIGFMTALGEVGRPPVGNTRLEFARFVAELLEPDLERLNFPPERVAQYMRLIAFASSIPQFNEGMSFDATDLTALLMTGIAGTSAVTTPTQQELHAY